MENNKKYWFFGSKLNTVLLCILIILMIVAIKIMLKDKDTYQGVWQKPSGQTTTIINPNVADYQSNKNTYTYTNHGFSVELPKGFVPYEEQSEGGPAIGIMLQNGFMQYITNADWWWKHNMDGFTYVKDEKIGQTTFQVYSYKTSYEAARLFYIYKQGNVAYIYNGGDVDTGDFSTLSSFKFIGWPR